MEFGYSRVISMLFVEFLTHLLLAKQLKQLLTKEIRLLSEETTKKYFLIEKGDKDINARLFYLIHPANNNSRENTVFSRHFSAFCQIFNSSFACSLTGETVETITDQRNSSIFGSDKIYIFAKKIEEMQFILFGESREQ